MMRRAILGAGAVAITLLAAICIPGHLPTTTASAPLASANFHARIDRGTLTLRGSLPSESSKAAILHRAQELYGTTRGRVVDAGKLRILAVASAQRLADFPNIPTVAEEGISGYEAGIWFGLFAPSQTPRTVVDAISGAVNQALATAAVREKLRTQFYEPWSGDPGMFQKFVKDETAKWTRTIRAANIKAD